MKDACVWLVGLVTILFAAQYIYQVYKHEIKPVLSTWITFFLSVGLSLITYAIAEKHDFRSGILNLMDFVATTAIFSAVIALGKRGVRFKPFEKWYLCGIVMIVIYGFLSGNTWNSNIFTQLLISTGYIPTIHNLLVGKKNTESIKAWSFGVIASLFALYPAMVNGNSLAVLYAVRGIFFSSVIILIAAKNSLKKE